jgi:hypothetical protein
MDHIALIFFSVEHFGACQIRMLRDLVVQRPDKQAILCIRLGDRERVRNFEAACPGEEKFITTSSV